MIVKCENLFYNFIGDKYAKPKSDFSYRCK